MKVEFCPIFSGTFCHGLGHGVGINIPVIGPVKTAEKTICIHQRMQFSHLFWCYKIYIKTKAAIHGIVIPKLIHSIGIICCTDGTSGMPASWLPCLLLQLLEYFDTLHIYLGTIIAWVIKRYIACRHPGRT